MPMRPKDRVYIDSVGKGLSQEDAGAEGVMPRSDSSTGNDEEEGRKAVARRAVIGPKKQE